MTVNCVYAEYRRDFHSRLCRFFSYRIGVLAEDVKKRARATADKALKNLAVSVCGDLLKLENLFLNRHFPYQL